MCVFEGSEKLLQRVVVKCNHNIDALNEPKLALFHSKFEPEFSATLYLHHLAHSPKVEIPQSLALHAIYLIDKILIKNPQLELCSCNIHRLVLAATVISNKVLYDDIFDNRWWAKRGGVSLDHLNDLEVNFLEMINYSVNSTLEVLNDIQSKLDNL